MGKQWVKLFTETINDVKLWNVSDTDRSVFFGLLCLAGEADNDGILYENEIIYKKLRNFLGDISRRKFWKSIENLEKIDCVFWNFDGVLVVKNFQKRQEMSKNKEEYNQKNYQKNSEKSEKIPSKISKKSEKFDENSTGKSEKNGGNSFENSEKIDGNSAEKSGKNQPVSSEKSAESENLTAENSEKIQNKFRKISEKSPLININNISNTDLIKEKEEEKELRSINRVTNVTPCGADDSKTSENSKNFSEKNSEKVSKKTSEKNPKLKPDQKEFWQHGFGPRADMAQAFYRVSGIYPVGKEFGHWQNDLKNFAEAGITVEQMEAAVKKVLKDGKYPIKSPGTVLTEARNIAAAAAASGGSATPKSNLDYLEDVEWEGCNE